MFHPVPQPALAIHRSFQGRGSGDRGNNLRISGKIEHEPSKLLVFLHKQWGTYRSNPFVCERGLSPALAAQRDPPSNGKGGAALLDGRLHRDFPERVTKESARGALALRFRC
jgi:hypothetical protein